MYNTEIPSRAELPSTNQLVRSTLIAAGVAAVLLVTTILPAEYGIDPTGLGRLTGLAEMGEIKSQLSEEAEADRTRDQQNSAPALTTDPERRSSLPGSIFAQLLIRPAMAHESGHGHGTEAQIEVAPPQPAQEPAQAVTGRTDEMAVTLEPGQGAEIKLVMKKGAKANYSWTAEGGAVNFDTHGDGPGGNAKSYEKGRAVKADEGMLEAAFDGNHGWFWRNRTKSNVTVKLRTNGDYAEIKRVM